MSPAAHRPRPVQRLAAFGALLALVGAMAAAGYVLVHNPAALPVTLLALVGAVIAGWLALINRGARRVIGRVNGRVFVNNVSLGAYAMVVQAEEYRAAKLSTAVAMLPDLLGVEAVPFDLRFNGPDGEAYTSAVLVLVSNNPYALATAAGLAGRPRIDTGELGVVVISGGLRQWTAGALRVESGGPVPVGIDGESLRMQPPLEFEALPGALRVRLPRGTIAPAAVGRVPGFRQTVAALIRILRNRPPWT